jgi:hypothetical protein
MLAKPRLDALADGIAVIGLVGQEDAAFGHGLDERIGLFAVARQALGFAVARQALGEVQFDRQAPAIDQRVDLARQTAPGTSHAAI